MSGQTQQQQIEARRKFVTAFNSTMVMIWRERITMLSVVRTGALYGSVIGMYAAMNNDASEFQLQQEFLTYGIWQNYGTGRETPRGNPGDIVRVKVRRKRPWFQPKYFGSVMNLRDFMGESLSLEYLAMMSNALSDDALRQSVTTS